MSKVEVIYWAGFTICGAIFALKRHWFIPAEEEKELVSEMIGRDKELEKYAVPFLATMGCIFWPIVVIERLYMVIKCK